MTAMADSSDRPSSKDVDDASADVQSKEEVSLETGTGGEEVWWEEPADQDPENPMNWPASRKWATIAVLSSITFVT